MKPLTTSVYTFSNLIEGGFLYVDKTAAIFDLIRPASAQYFLARPRRFGKSLLISTLKAIFQGRRELFDGLSLTSTDYDWQPYPVIHLDLGAAAAQTPVELEEHLWYAINRNAKEYGIALTRERAAGRFLELVESLADRDGKVVILVDEYDKPLLGHLGQPTVTAIQSLLKQFYSVIKTTESHQRFALITGVSKFTKVSIFSDLNNLTDLTMDPRTATLLGYTQDELEANFPDYIGRLAGAIGKTDAETLEELRTWYNGYRFEENAQTVYNPVSVMKCLDTQKFMNYWFETGTPTFLVDLLRENPVDLDNLQAPETVFSTYDPANLAPLPLLVQTGYLTIRQAVTTGRHTPYTLGFPNFEIEESFSMVLSCSFANLDMQTANSALMNMVKALQHGDVDAMLEHLKTFFHKVPSTIVEQKEKYYQTIFFTVFKLVGAMIDAEVNTSLGRIAAVVQTARHVMLFEFKLNGTAADAMDQIKNRQYTAGYRDDPRQVVLVGVEFDWKDRNLGAWLIEKAFTKDGDGAKVREAPPAYGGFDQIIPGDRETLDMTRAVNHYVNACQWVERAEENRKRFAGKMIASWAPFIHRVWQSWTPTPNEVCAMLFLEDRPPAALRHVVKDCKNRNLRTMEVAGSDFYYRTELDANPAENECSMFPVPLAVYERLASIIDLKWIDRSPRLRS